MSENDKAEIQQLAKYLGDLGEHLDEFLRFEHPDALATKRQWLEGITSHCPVRPGAGPGWQHCWRYA